MWATTFAVLVAGCASFGSGASPVDGVAATDAAATDGSFASDGGEGAENPELPRPRTNDCPTDPFYCEPFTNKQTLSDFALEGGATLALIGTVGGADRALLVTTDVGGTLRRAQIMHEEVGQLPPVLTLSFVLTSSTPTRVNLAEIVIRTSTAGTYASTDYHVYVGTQGGVISLFEYRESPPLQSSGLPFGRIDDGQPHRVEVSVDFQAKAADARLDTEESVHLDMTSPPSRAVGFGIAYGATAAASWDGPAARLVYDDVVLAPEPTSTDPDAGSIRRARDAGAAAVDVEAGVF